jgi:formate hydrogenlyase subunit 6/NADH:ubiquinone oxidoreductase subunit I
MYFSIGALILKWVGKKPSTRLFPFEKREAFAGSRGHIEIDINTCTFCTLCQKKCPTGAITVKRAEKIWEIDRLKCIVCGACVDACPKDCIVMKTNYSAAQVVHSIESHTPSVKDPAPAAA